MSKLEKQVTAFCLQGQVAHVFFDGCKPKYLQLMTSSGLHLIKLSKESRLEFERILIPGQQVQVSGMRKYDPKKGKIKLKAEQVVAFSTETQLHPSTTVLPPKSEVKQTKTGKAQILVCQKSSCCKKGGSRLYMALENTLRDKGLDQQVTIKKTGCLKRCKLGPNVVVMPDKASYTQVNVHEASEIIAQHF